MTEQEKQGKLTDLRSKFKAELKAMRQVLSGIEHHAMTLELILEEVETIQSHREGR
ncbi:MAG: hypothetical protein U0822_08715 [Anaerolineae bacterium]